MRLNFEWHQEKAEKNLRKHGVSFDEARTVFQDTLMLVKYDDTHSEDEERYISVGRSGLGRILTVVHTDRGNVIRIISARLATRQEVKTYEEEPW